MASVSIPGIGWKRGTVGDCDTISTGRGRGGREIRGGLEALHRMSTCVCVRVHVCAIIIIIKNNNNNNSNNKQQ